MASVRELLDTRVGGVRGQHGTEGHTRSFHVTTDAVGDDPSAIIQATAGGVAMGSPHPWGAFGVVVIGFAERERMTQTDWIVDALYGAPLTIAPDAGWDFDLDTALETYTAYKDIEGQTIGPAVYHPIPTVEEFPGDRLAAENNRLRDKLKFNTAVVDAWAPTPSGYLGLYRLANDKRRATGLPATKKMATFILSKTLPNLFAGQVASVISMVNTVNITPFFGAARGMAKFIGMRSRSSRGTIPGQSTPDRVYDVSLTFLINWEKHNPEREYDIYEHTDGTQAIIEDARGNGIRRKYKLYYELEFNTILLSLG